MRKDCSFTSKGLRCSGWLYTPDDRAAGQKAPVIVMAHGFTAVKEQGLSDFAQRFVAAGFATLVFDYRYFGDSEGEPRSQVFPLEMVEDYRNAITWVSDQPEVDGQRLGIWGTSFSGGLVLWLATFDSRVKAVVAQVPFAHNLQSRRAANPELTDRMAALLLRDRIERYKTGAVNYMKVVAPEGEPCVLPGEEAYEGYMATKELGPNWRNQVSLESLEKIREFDPVSLIHMIAPKPLLMITAEKDTVTPFGVAKAAYERAQEPKAFLALPIRHFEIYQEPWLSKAADAEVDWFRKYL